MFSIFLQVIIEAIRGAHYTSDVAVDGLVFSAGLCDKEAEGNYQESSINKEFNYSFFFKYSFNQPSLFLLGQNLSNRFLGV